MTKPILIFAGDKKQFDFYVKKHQSLEGVSFVYIRTNRDARGYKDGWYACIGTWYEKWDDEQIEDMKKYFSTSNIVPLGNVIHGNTTAI